MIKVERSAQINKPAADIFGFTSDFANDAKWQADLISSEKTSAGPIGVGTTGRYVQKFMGMEMKNDMLVTAFEPPTRFAAKTTSGPVQFEYLMTLEESGGSTRINVTMTGEPGGFFKVAAGLLKKELEKSLDRDFAKLKELLEA